MRKNENAKTRMVVREREREFAQWNKKIGNKVAIK